MSEYSSSMVYKLTGLLDEKKTTEEIGPDIRIHKTDIFLIMEIYISNQF